MIGGRSFADPEGGPAVRLDRHGADMVAMEEFAIATLEAIPLGLWDGTPPVAIERIAEEHFGLIVLETEDPSEIPGAAAVADGNHFSGMLVADRGEIWVNAADAREWPPRKLFTIAHELGHWLLHRHSEDPSIYQAAHIGPGDTEQTPDRGKGISAREALPRLEAEANAFAAALLLPACLLRPAHAECEGDSSELQRIFNSSQGALERRAKTLGLELTGTG